MPRRAPQKGRLPLSITSLVLAMGTSRAWSQSIYLPNDQLQLTAPKLRYLTMDAEFEDVSYRPKTGAGAINTQEIYLAPAFGISWDYFLYHPDLLTYSLLAEPGYNWQQYNYAGSSSQQNEFFVNGNFKATLLQLKPYATTFTYSRGHDETQYNFYTSVTQDSQNWGVLGGYSQGPVPFTVSFQQSEIDSTSLSLNTTSDQTSINLHATNSRRFDDVTDLSYQYSDYDSTSNLGSQNYQDTSTTHYVTLTDVEHFGQNTLSSSLLFNDQDLNDISSDNINLSLDLDVVHTPHLHSFYDYSVQDYSTSGLDSLYQLGRLGLRHQLYESLTTTVDIHAALSDSTSPGASLDQQSAGTDLNLDYIKHVGDWGQLSIGNNLGYDLTQQSSSGNELPVNNESHTVPATGLFYLNQPLDLAVQSITFYNGATTITLVPGTAPAGDYDVITTSDPWQIRIYATGPNHINLATSPVVQVNYTIQPNPSGNYSTINDQFQVRLDFWHDHAGLYARYNYTENSASSPAFVLDNISEFQAGADMNWGGFRADANYTDHESSFYSYQSVSLSEGYSLRTTLHSTAGIDLRQQWSVYGDGHTNASPDVTYYSFTAHYDWHPLSGLSWHNEAGYEKQTGAGEDQTLLVARSYLNWFIGKLDFRLGYEYQNQEYPAETDNRNYVFLRMRRNF